MFAFLTLIDTQLTAAVVALVTILITTLAATPLRYVVDRALLVQKSKAEYEYDARKELRALIGRYHGRVLDAAVDLHDRMGNLYGDQWDPARYRQLDVHGPKRPKHDLCRSTLGSAQRSSAWAKGCRRSLLAVDDALDGGGQPEHRRRRRSVTVCSVTGKA